MSLSIVQDSSCKLLYIAYFFLTRWDMVLTVRSGWGNRGDSQVDGLRWLRGEAGVDKSVGSHFFHDSGSLKGLSSLMGAVMVRRG